MLRLAFRLTLQE